MGFVEGWPIDMPTRKKTGKRRPSKVRGFRAFGVVGLCWEKTSRFGVAIEGG